MANLTPTPQYVGELRALESTDFAVPALWNDLNQVLLDQDAWLRARILGTQSGAELQAGSVTDVHLGTRTVSPAAPAGDTNTLTGLLSNLANRLQAATGAASWRDPPATTLANAQAHITSNTGVHGATSAATPNRLIMRDASGRARVAAPQHPEDIARKQDVDDAVLGTSNHVGTGGNAHALATTSAHGFMSSGDKSKLDAYPATAASAPTPNAAIARDSFGRAQVAAPSSGNDIARKADVDAVAGLLSTHSGLGGSAHPVATPSTHGFMSSSDKSKLDAATAGYTVSTVVMRDSAGRFSVATPQDNTHAVNKSYVDANAVSPSALNTALNSYYTRGQVDNLLSSKANASHTHQWASITNRPSTFPPSAHAHHASEINSGQLSAARLPADITGSTWVQERIAAGSSTGVPNVGEYTLARYTGDLGGLQSPGGLVAGNHLIVTSIDPGGSVRGGPIPPTTSTWRAMSAFIKNDISLWLRVG